MDGKENYITIGKTYIEKKADRTSLCARVVDWEGKEELVCISVDAEYGEYLVDDRADAFVVGLLLSAMRSGSNIVCEEPLTHRLCYQLNHYLIPMLAANLKELHPIRICAETTENRQKCEGAIGMHWSDDIGSMYTLKEHLDIKEQDYRLTHLLITNHQVPDGSGHLEPSHKWVEAVKKNIAEEWNVKVVSVNSNLYEIQNGLISAVSTFFHASTVLALQKLFGGFLVPAEYAFSEFSFDSAHCTRYDLATLGCLETDTTVFYSAGGAYTQECKQKALLDFPLMQKFPYIL